MTAGNDAPAHAVTFQPPTPPSPATADSACETCGTGPRDHVSAVPGVPVAVGRCDGCVEADAFPWWVIVSNTVAMDGLSAAADWWVDLVETSLAHMGRTRAEFDAAVRDDLERERACHVLSLADYVEDVRRGACAYAPDGPCDCKHAGHGPFDQHERSGCPELRDAVRALHAIAARITPPRG